MTSTPRPPDGGSGPPTESWLRALLRLGRRELAAVDEARLTRIWHRVDDELDAADDARVSRPTRLGSSTGVGRGDTSTVTGIQPTAPAPPAAPVGRGGWRRHVPLAAAAGVALVVGVGLGASLTNADDPPETVLADAAPAPTDPPATTASPTPTAPAATADEPAATTLATYELEPLTTDGSVEVAAVAAVLVADGEGRALEVDLAELPVADGFHEVWLLDPDTGALASLGPVRPDGRYVVPSGTDLDALKALDVSVEPLDGDPGHSGVSLLRGEVRWVG